MLKTVTLLEKNRIKEAADYLGVSTKTLRRWGKSGKLVGKRTFGNQRYYTKEQLERFALVNKLFDNPSPVVSSVHRPPVVIKWLVATGLWAFVVFFANYLIQNQTLKKESVDSKLSTVSSSNSSVLAASTGLGGISDKYTFTVNVPSEFNNPVVFNENITAPNIVTSVNGDTGDVDVSLTAGTGISLDGLKITNSGIVSLSAGSGISVSGSTITNSDLGSSQLIFKTIAVSGQSSVASDTNTDTLTLSASGGITITTNATTDTITIDAEAPDYTLSGWTDNGTSITLSTLTDTVTIPTVLAATGINNQNSGITNAGSITGGTGFTSSGTITLAGLSTGILHANSSGVLSSSAVALGSADVSGALGISNGGTGLTSFTLGDIIYASATNTLAKLGAGGENEVLAMVSGIPDWTSITGGGGLCTNCLVNNPGSDQTITPTAGTGLIIKKASSGTSDVFKVTSTDGVTAYLRIDTDGNVLLGNGQTTQGVFTVAPSGTHPITISPSTPVGTAYTGTITTGDLTATRTWTFPDATGIVCTTSGNCSGSSSALGGSGTLNYISKWAGTYSLGNSLLFDDGTYVGISDATPTYTLDVNGTLRATGATTLDTTLGVTGATTLSSTLGVTGATTLSSTLGVTGATTLSSTLGVTGNATFNGQITAPKVNKVIIVDGNIYPQTCAGINTALTALGAGGGEIYLPEGDYTCAEQILIQADYTYIHGAGEKTNIISTGLAANTINLDARDYITLDNFRITHTGTGGYYEVNGYGAPSRNDYTGSSYSRFSNLTINSTNNHCMYFRYAWTGTIIENNNLRTCAGAITTTSDGGNTHNILRNNYFESNSSTQSIITIGDHWWTITGNTIKKSAGSYYGFYVTGDYSNISDNSLEYADIRLAAADYTTVANNNFYGSLLQYIRLEANSSHNLIIGNNLVGIATDRYGIYLAAGSNYNSIRSNRISGLTNASGTYGTAITLESGANYNEVSDNFFYNNRVDVSDAGTDTRLQKSSGTNLALGSLDNTPDASLEIIKQSTTPLFMLSSSADTNGDYLYVGNTGGVGIGTTSPNDILEVLSTSDAQLRLAYDTTNYSALQVANDGGLTWSALGTDADLNFDFSGATDGDFSVNTNDLFVDTSTGYVGIGNTSPDVALEITGNLYFSNHGSVIYGQGGDMIIYVNNVANQIYLERTASGGGIGFGTNNPGSKVGILGNAAIGATYGTAAAPTSGLLIEGNVGIGTTSPTNILSLGGTGARTIWMERNTTAATAGQGLTLSSGGAIAGTADLAGGDLTLKSGISTGTGTSALRFFTATAGSTGTSDNTPTEKMTILGSGYVGIGVTAPSYALDVKGSGTGVIARFNSDNSTGCTLADGGTITCSSDASLKKNVLGINYGLSDILKLNPVSFNWNYEGDGVIKTLGFIAQDVESILPGLVKIDDNGLRSLNTIGLVPVLARAIQEQQLVIDEIKLSSVSATISNEEWNTTVTKIDEFIAFVNSIIDGFKEKFTTKEICLSGEDNSETCIKKDQLDELMKLLPTPTATPSATPIETVTPSPESSLTPEASPSATPSASLSPEAI
jgi:excisionase family DNA binding protein